MIRSELLQALAKENSGLRAEEVERVADVFFDEIAQRLAADGRVELRGFGAFSTRDRNPRRGRNPRTGEAVERRMGGNFPWYPEAYVCKTIPRGSCAFH